MATLGTPSRPIVRHSLRVAILPLVLAVLAVLSLSYPLAAPVVAAGGGVVALLNARRTSSRAAWAALAVCGVVLVLSLVIDLGLLAVSTSQIGHTKPGTSG